MTEKEQHIIDKLIERVETSSKNDSSGHDFEHIMRVYKTAMQITENEKADKLTVAIAALTHDLGDYKLSDDGKEHHREKIIEYTKNLKIAKSQLEKIIHIVENVSFKGSGNNDTPLSLEGNIVRDADRLDAIGAIGIARAFAYGSSRQRKMYDYSKKPQKQSDFETYKNSEGTTINHFYEKLFLLKDRMVTDTAKKIAKKRHDFMKEFVKLFENETK